MEEIMQKANELGQLIANSELTKKMQAAETAVNTDTDLQGKIGTFNEKREQMMNMMQSGVEDKEKIDPLNQEIKDMYDAIMANKNMTDYNIAKSEFDEMFNKVSGVITYYITGEEPGSGCGGNCGSCGGCH